MSNLNHIENKLRELGDAAFQKLADAYLHEKGYEQLNSLGSVIGADKARKGTPDTIIMLPNDKYVFAEYTTQQSDLYSKLIGDLAKCLDEKKTGILRSKIAEVVFCYTTELDSSEIDGLREECQTNQVNLSVFGISRIANDLLLKYPIVAREFLGIELDTGQILDLDEFVSAYNKNVLATPLDTAFHFRQDEMTDVLKLLESRDLVIIGGRAGVGKSRFAVECCKEFAKGHAEFQIRCIFNRGPDIFTDLQLHFSEPGHYLIFVDDANRINRFDYVLQLLQNQSANRRIKLVVTARDYAVEKIKDIAGSYAIAEYRELQDLDKNQIKQLVEDECGIKNHLYLDRIADIAKGNPRLAIMAGRVASRENRLDSITDVSALYDEYFSSIRKDIEDLRDTSVVVVAGLVAFFRSVDRTNQELMNSIETAFGVPRASFWNCALRLHETEILDLWENEVVRFSDQVLATYVFYLCFFKQRAVSFANLLIAYFPRQKERLYDSFYPVLNAFYSEGLMEVVRKDIDSVWDTYHTAGDAELILSLSEAFWFVKGTDVLLYVKDLITKLQSEPILLKEEVKPDSNIHSPSILGVLKRFSQSDEGDLRIALALIYDYVEKRAVDLPKVHYILTEAFGFHHKSYLHDFYVQRSVVETLWERTQKSMNSVLMTLQFLVYKHYLQTRFHTTESADRHTFNIITFQLPSTPALRELRHKIWRNLFELYDLIDLRPQILDTLGHYSTSGYAVSVDEIVVNDSAEILPFVNSVLNPESYSDCGLAHDLLDLFENHGVPVDQTLRSKFTNKTHQLAEILFDDNIERRNLKLEYEEYKKLKQQRISEYFREFTLVDYLRFFDSCAQIKVSVADGHEEYQFQEGVSEVLTSLADRDRTLYANVLQNYVALGDPLSLNPVLLVDRLLDALGHADALDILRFQKRSPNIFVRIVSAVRFWILKKPAYPTQRKWLFAYYQILPSDKVTKANARQVYRLYKSARRDEPPHHLDYLVKYWHLDRRVFVRITNAIIRKSGQDPLFGHSLSLLFNPHLEVNKRIIEFYRGNSDLLKKAFFCVLEVDPHADYDGTSMGKILDVDPNFMADYIHWIYGKKKWVSKYDDSRNYSFLWRQDGYPDTIARIVDCVLANELKEGMLFGTYLETFFALREATIDKDLIKERQNKFIESLIKRQHQNASLMKLIFLLITSFEPERRRSCIAHFIAHNKKFVDFKSLALEPRSQSWSGSRVPVLKKSVEYFESLLPIFNTSDLLEHKQMIEYHISSLQKQLEYEKKRDFIDD